MIAYLRKLTIRNIVSPYGLAAISYCIFLFAWLFPPGLYTQYIEEPDLMFLDPLTFVFYTSCVVAFLLGTRFARMWQVADLNASSAHAPMDMPLIYLLVPVVLATGACTVYMLLIGAKLNSVVLLASQQGEMLKKVSQTAKVSGSWAAFLVILTAILWWALFRAQELKLRGSSKCLFYPLFLIGVIVDILTCVEKVDRTNLMPLVAGLLVIYLYGKTRAINVSAGRLLFNGAASVICLIGCFLTLSFLRGALILRLLLVSLMGYTIVSYNRLAAILGGIMHYMYEGRGVYLAIILNQDEKADAIRRHFGWPNSFDLWQTEFSSTFSAGLNPTFIWSGAFGYLYSDIGWWTLLYIFFVGIIAGILWHRFNRGKVSGVVLYPWLAFCILFWTGTNYLLDGRIFRFAEMVIALWIYDEIFLRRRLAARRYKPGFRLKDGMLASASGGHSSSLSE